MNDGGSDDVGLVVLSGTDRKLWTIEGAKLC